MKLFWMVMLIITRKAAVMKNGLVVDNATGEVLRMVRDKDKKEYNKTITAAYLRDIFKGRW